MFYAFPHLSVCLSACIFDAHLLLLFLHVHSSPWPFLQMSIRCLRCPASCWLVGSTRRCARPFCLTSLSQATRFQAPLSWWGRSWSRTRRTIQRNRARGLPRSPQGRSSTMTRLVRMKAKVCSPLPSVRKASSPVKCQHFLMMNGFQVLTPCFLTQSIFMVASRKDRPTLVRHMFSHPVVMGDLDPFPYRLLRSHFVH